MRYPQFKDFVVPEKVEHENLDPGTVFHEADISLSIAVLQNTSSQAGLGHHEKCRTYSTSSIVSKARREAIRQ